MLVPIALLPLSIATSLLIFGRAIEHWMIEYSAHELRSIVLVGWRLARWSLAVVTTATVIGAIYHFGTRHTEKWTSVAPGAVGATLLWVPVTLIFGVYITRVADYSVIYGSLGTAIATLVWLYITSFSVILGAQFNGVLHRERLLSQSSAPVDAPEQEQPPIRITSVSAAESPAVRDGQPEESTAHPRP
jgi:membrane protein